VLLILKALRHRIAAMIGFDSTDWKNDWLYSLILKEAEKQWVRFRPPPDEDYWQFVLVEEWSSCNGSRCAGQVIRVWKRDKKGLRQISLIEHRRHERNLEIWRRKGDSRFFPYIQSCFTFILIDNELSKDSTTRIRLARVVAI
jgi:hypothetical protein